MKKINFTLIRTGDILQEQLGLPDNAETLHVNVEYPIDGRFNIKPINITKCHDVGSKKRGCYCVSYGPFLFERYVRSIKTLKDDIKGQHELIESVKSFVIQYLESLDVLSIQDGEEIVLDEAEVVA